MIRRPPRSTLFPYTTLFRSWTAVATANLLSCLGKEPDPSFSRFGDLVDEIGMMLADVHKRPDDVARISRTDRKSTRLNSSHRTISYAVFCLKKKKNKTTEQR